MQGRGGDERWSLVGMEIERREGGIFKCEHCGRSFVREGWRWSLAEEGLGETDRGKRLKKRKQF